MGLFSGVINSVRNSVSSILDSTTSIIGNVSDFLRPESKMDKTEIQTGIPYIFPETVEYDIYDDFIDWIDSFWY